MLRENIIEEKQILWVAPIVFAPKKDLTPHFRLYYRKLNAIVKQDLYPFPCMDEYVLPQGEATVLSLLDASSGY